VAVTAPDIEKLGATFFERGWLLIDLPKPEVVAEVRDAVRDKLRALMGNPVVTLETYHEHATDEAHEKLQWELTNFFWEHKYARRILETHVEFFRRFIGLDLHIQARPYLRIARPGRADDNIGYHRDIDYGSSAYEVSCHVPLTDVDERGCLRMLDGSHELPPDAFPKLNQDTGVEKKSQKHQMGFVYRTQRLPSSLGPRMTPVSMHVGQLLMFSLAIAHGQEVNEGAHSRVSFDVRLVNSLAPIQWEKTVSDNYYEEFAQSAMLRQAQRYYRNVDNARRVS
jgi:hypothetical protein